MRIADLTIGAVLFSCCVLSPIGLVVSDHLRKAREAEEDARRRLEDPCKYDVPRMTALDPALARLSREHLEDLLWLSEKHARARRIRDAIYVEPDVALAQVKREMDTFSGLLRHQSAEWSRRCHTVVRAMGTPGALENRPFTQ